MFENISFLFLFAMALFSWAVLCLQHAVEIQVRDASEYRVELYTDRPGITFEPHVFHKPSETSPLSGALDFARSFWVILVLTFGLSNLVQLAERQAKNYLTRSKSLKLVNATEFRFLTESPAAEQTLPTCQRNEEIMNPVALKENTAIREQLNVLQTHCLAMRELLDELRLSKSSSSLESVRLRDEGVLEHSGESMTIKKELSSIAESVFDLTQPLYRKPESFTLTAGSTQHSQNIYITNSHIHIGGPVFCSNHDFSMELCRQASMYSRKQSEFLQVWGKYITGPKERPMIAGMRCNNILL